jgi:hypothetical protein
MEWEKGEPVLYFDSLKIATTEGTAETVYAQGGKGNPRLIAWEGDKTVTFTFEDALISAEGISILAGADLIDASADQKIRVHKKAVVQVDENDVLDLTDVLDGETLVEDEIFGFIVDANGEIVERLGKATVDGDDTIIFENRPLVKSELVLIDYYVEKSTGIKEISITPDKFAGYFYIEGDTLFRRQSDGKDLAAQIIIPNAKIQTAFNFSMSPSGDPTTFTFTADALPGTLAGDPPGADKKLYALRIVDPEVPDNPDEDDEEDTGTGGDDPGTGGDDPGTGGDD